jgi:hypothetical protein
MKQILNKIKSFFCPKEYTLGPEVFECRSWLDKKVDDALWKRHNQID